MSDIQDTSAIDWLLIEAHDGHAPEPRAAKPTTNRGHRSQKSVHCG